MRLVFHFGIRERRLRFRIPVHQARAAIDQAFAKEIDEELRDRERQFGIQREALALPVGAEAEPLELIVDAVAVLFAPLPRAREERVASQPVAGEAFLGEFAHQHGFGCDRGVILTGQPGRVFAAHPMIAREHVHRRVGRTVPEMRRAGDVRRRHRDDERRAPGIDFGMEHAGGEIAREDARLDVGGIVGLGEVRAHVHPSGYSAATRAPSASRYRVRTGSRCTPRMTNPPS